MGQIICHCVAKDCSNCPMKNKGTSGILAKYDSFYKYDKKNKNKK